MAAVADAPPIVHPKLAEASFGAAIRPLLDEPSLYASQGIRLLRYDYPILDVDLTWEARGVTLMLRVVARDFNYRPIRGWWIKPDGNALEAGVGLMPAGRGFHANGRADGQLGGWFCYPGWSEWHDHNGHHKERSWASLRSDRAFAPLALIVQLHSNLKDLEVKTA
jgi:hypothetical protein